jgi:hypothetical protein
VNESNGVFQWDAVSTQAIADHHPVPPKRKNSEDLIPKNGLLCGNLIHEIKRCGKPRCRCLEGEPHGPYWYRRWREGGRLRRQYVPRTQLEQVRTAIARWHEVHPPLSRLRGLLRELDALARELEQ